MLLPAAAPFHRATRDARWAELDRESFDLAVIGGGITGAGIARDAAMRGLKTVLFERGDLASGTSSASSKLVHGGLRYLQQGEVRLVWESVSERARLRQLAPHLVRPLPFLFPIYGGKPRPRWMVSTGLWLYEALALFRVWEVHDSHDARRTLDLEPSLRRDGLDGSVTYHDAMTDDARLTLATARGAHDAGAWVFTYASVKGLRFHRGQVTGVEVEDRRTGHQVTVAARAVVNATGPWTDRVLGLRDRRSRLVRPTKGVHIVVPHARLPIAHTVVMHVPADRRIVFAIPSGCRVIVGTTDTDYEGDYDQVYADAADVRYLLDVTNDHFLDAHLCAEDVVGTWAGLRPLVAVDGLSESEVPREHLLKVDEDGLISIFGGKLTTYRLMAAETVDLVARKLRQEGLHVGRCQTGAVPLPGGTGIVERRGKLHTAGPDGATADAELAARFGEDVADSLKASHGGRWVDVAARVEAEPALGQRIVPDLPYLWAEVDHAVEEEMAVGLLDVMRRRTQIQIRDEHQGMVVAEAVAVRMGQHLGWGPEDIRRQVALYMAESQRLMAWRG